MADMHAAQGDQLPQQTELAVELRAVSKRFGAVQALRDLTLTIRRGEVVTLLGPNGAGKTTAIGIMLGLSRPSSGQVSLLGLDPRNLRARSRCGIMLQESGVPGNLTVRELIALFRSYYPAPLPNAQVIAAAGLEGMIKTRAGALSGGQRQRLYFALALCGDPDLLFLDEPTAALDVEARRAFWRYIREVVTGGKTIVLTTHYLEEADALADRVLLIDHGRLVADASPADLKGRVSGKRMSFDALPELDEGAFDGVPVQQLELRQRHASLLTPEPEHVLQALAARGVEVRNLEVSGVGLEEAILALTSPTVSSSTARSPQ
jgi:ABC-2 type transport system ATP-binding protein